MVSDSDDEDLKTAIALSLSHQQNASDQLSPDRPAEKESPVIKTVDLKALHDERQARRSGVKRQVEVSPPPLSRKAPRVEASTALFSSGAMLRSFSTTVQQDQQGRKPEVANAANNRMKQQAFTLGSVADDVSPQPGTEQHPHLSYPRGVVKQTWAFGHPRDGNDVKLEEVLEPSSVRTAVMSAFQWDTEWLLAKLRTPANGGRTKCVFIMEAKTANMKQQMLRDTQEARSWLRLCFPPMDGGVFCMHSKLMLLFHERKLRIVVPTANLLNFDWGETGVMENSAFMIDLPRLEERKLRSTDGLTFFGKELLFFLEKQGVDEDIRAGILGFDFVATKDIAFVHTVGGTSFGEDGERTGLPGLSRAVRRLNLESDDNTQIDFVTSSCGALRDEYLRNMHSAVRGLNLTAQASAVAAQAKSTFFDKRVEKAGREETPDIREQIRVYFPTYDTVRASTAGAVGTVCMERKYYENAEFPKKVLRDYVSNRSGLLSHNKLLYARGHRPPAAVDSTSLLGAERAPVAWLYVGSANISQSAWGNSPTYDKARKAWKVYCRNWECGVLLPVNGPGDPSIHVAKEDSETESEGDDDAIDLANDSSGLEMNVFDPILPIPCQYPGPQYNGREPWYFKEQVK